MLRPYTRVPRVRASEFRHTDSKGPKLAVDKIQMKGAPNSMTPRTASREIFNIDLQSWMAHGSIDDINYRAELSCHNYRENQGRKNVDSQQYARQEPGSCKTVQPSHRENLLRYFLEKIVLLRSENQRLNAENLMHKKQASNLKEDQAVLLIRLEESVGVSSALRAQLASAHEELAQLKERAACRSQSSASARLSVPA